ncbi:Uncharacterised protein [BD1-7 clade bacterium]|nr:Uncharacterised protein [BD1-7 clade bacterium]
MRYPQSVLFLVACLLTACSNSGSSSNTKTSPDNAVTPREWLPVGGTATIPLDSSLPFLQFIPDLDILAYPEASLGRELFVAEWEVAPSTRETLDGFGPLAITNACDTCHLSNGRAASLLSDGTIGPGLLFRLGTIDGQHDTYLGNQVQTFAAAGQAEGSIRWQADVQSGGVGFTFIPTTTALEPGINLGPRLSPQLAGIGLLDLVSDDDILAWADSDDADNNGISGRVHWRQNQIGRFGWKAIHTSLRNQSAGALQGDMGLTTTINPTEPCTAMQTVCDDQPNGGDPEVSDHALDAINAFLTLLAVPDRRFTDADAFDAGADVFDKIGCADCHRPTLKTGVSEQFSVLSGQTIYPYTDLLLHDMGPALSDGVKEGDANPAEWRTPPLWTLGLIENTEGARFLHDGRAANLQEAIEWHGGEATNAKQAFDSLTEDERADLMLFLRSI